MTLTPAMLPRPTRVGVYIDAYNLYYGARQVCGRGRPGWRWLDLRSLAVSLVGAPLATKGPKGQPILTRPTWPITVQSPLGTPDGQAIFMVSHLHQEEKGTDVNVATYMLTDVLEGRVDAVVVVSNDSDLQLPVRLVRQRVPVGHVNPRQTYFAGDLHSVKTDGVGNHWWRKLSESDYQAHQLPDPAGAYRKPAGW